MLSFLNYTQEKLPQGVSIESLPAELQEMFLDNGKTLPDLMIQTLNELLIRLPNDQIRKQYEEELLIEFKAQSSNPPSEGELQRISQLANQLALESLNIAYSKDILKDKILPLLKQKLKEELIKSAAFSSSGEALAEMDEASLNALTKEALERLKDEIPSGVFNINQTLYCVVKPWISQDKRGKSVELAKGRSTVTLVQNLKTGKVFALKILADKTCEEFFAKESTVLFLLKRSPHLVPIAKMRSPEGNSTKEFSLSSEEGTFKLYALQNYVSGKDLWYVLQENELSLEERFDIGLKILTKLKDLYAKGIRHCDLKLENIMVDLETGKVTIIDFDSVLLKNEQHHSIVGTNHYQAPEIIKYHHYSEKSDVYALSVVFKYLFKLPIKTNGFGHTKIVLEDLDPHPIEEKSLTLCQRLLAPLIARMSASATHRISINDAYKELNRVKNVLFSRPTLQTHSLLSKPAQSCRQEEKMVNSDNYQMPKNIF